MGWRSFWSSVDDNVFHPAKEHVQSLTSKATGIWADNTKQVLPDKLQGSWIDSYATLADTGRQLEKSYWEKPAQTFAENVDYANSAFPRALRPYAPQIEAVALSMFSPWAGAAFTTSYNAGKRQQASDSWDWDALAKDAAINFGTAAVASAAKGIQAGQAADASKASAQANGLTMSQGFDATSAANPAGYSQGARVAMGDIASSAAPSSMQGFKAAVTTAAAKAAPQVANAALTSALTPTASTPLSGIEGDLGAFGQYELLDSNAGDPAITSDELSTILSRQEANTALRGMDLMDQFRIGGRGASYIDDSRYRQEADNILKSASEERQGLVAQANAANYAQAIQQQNNISDANMRQMAELAGEQDDAALTASLNNLGYSMDPAEFRTLFTQFRPIYGL